MCDKTRYSRSACNDCYTQPTKELGRIILSPKQRVPDFKTFCTKYTRATGTCMLAVNLYAKRLQRNKTVQSVSNVIM